MARQAITGRQASSSRVAISNRLSTGQNILPNGNFEFHPAVLTAATNTNNRWIDGTAAGSTAPKGANWAPISITASAEVGFDTTIQRSGTTSMRLSTLNATGLITAAVYRQSPSSSTLFELLTFAPSTQYTLVGYIRTNNVATNGAFLDLREFNSTAGTVVTTSSNKLSGTDTSWRQVTLTVTTNSATRFGTVFLRNNVAGNTSDAWFDDITLISNTTDIGRVAA